MQLLGVPLQVIAASLAASVAIAVVCCLIFGPAGDDGLGWFGSDSDGDGGD